MQVCNHNLSDGQHSKELGFTNFHSAPVRNILKLETNQIMNYLYTRLIKRNMSAHTNIHKRIINKLF